MARSTLIDLTGQRFGRYLVTARGQSRPGEKRAYWLCRCDCGSEVVVRGKNLRNGTSRSCGCLTSEVARTKVVDLTGQRFGRLFVVARAEGRGSDTKAYWLCRCDCGKETVVVGTDLRAKGDRRKGVVSCGCWRSDWRAAREADRQIAALYGDLE